MRVLITGAARAIGAATARVLTDHGCDVIATARNIDLLAEVPAVQRIALDVNDANSVHACVAAAGAVDVLVNNAAIAESGPLESYPVERFRASLETNVIGPLRMIQAVVPGMRARGRGTVVNISSVQGRVATPLDGPYSASKFALEALSESLHYEMAHFGIRVVVIEPGYIAPGMKDSPRWGVDGHPYDELAKQWFGADARLVGEGGRTSPDVVGETIWRAIAAERHVLRWPVGPDAELVLQTRQELDDEAFESAMRSTLNLTW